jgi:hypothetical protein
MDDKAKAAFEAHAKGAGGSTSWDDAPEVVKAAWRAAISTTHANDPKLVNVAATGTIGTMIGTNPNLNPSVSPPAATPARETTTSPSGIRTEVHTK